MRRERAASQAVQPQGSPRAAPHRAIATEVQPPGRSAQPAGRATGTSQSVPRAHSLPLPPEQFSPRRQQRTPRSFPKTRRFLHSGTWSSLDDAWSGLARLRLDTISLRDDRLSANQPARERAIHRAVASGRIGWSARYPIYDAVNLTGLVFFILRLN